MAITINSIGALALGTTTNVVVPYPATIAAGDRLIVIIAAIDNIVSSSTGWTLKSGINNGASIRSEVFYLTAAALGTETGSVTFTRTSAVGSIARMFALSGAISSGDPIEAIANSVGTSSTVTFPALTTLTNNAMVFGTMCAWGNNNPAQYGVISGTDPTFVEQTDDLGDSRVKYVDALNTGLSTAATTINITVPATAQVGDLAVALISVKSSTITATRTGWTTAQAAQGDAASPASRLFTLTHTVASGEPGTALAFTLSSSVKAAGIIAIFRNANTTTPINTSAGQVNASSTTVSAPSITSTANGVNVISAYGPSIDSLMTAYSGTGGLVDSTVAASGGSVATRCAVGMGHFGYLNTTTVGATSATLASASTAAGVSLGINSVSPSGNVIGMAVDVDYKTVAGLIASGRTATGVSLNTNVAFLFAIKPAPVTAASFPPFAGALSRAVTFTRPRRRVLPI